tara:strand:+ start:4170 stop:19922 length:15753 start_codon:yes stop_codon:yes gene_type:complete
MAYDKDQMEPALPGGDDSIRRKSENHLPRYFRTSHNSKFLSSTLDQLIQPGVAEKLNGYLGRKVSKAFKPTDNYIGAVTSSREQYQLEPAAVIKDNLGNVTYYKDYNDYINTVSNLGGSVTDHSRLNTQETYAWNPHIDWDKFTNYREYYWLPNGPDLVTVIGQTKDVISTYTVALGQNVDNVTYVFSPDGLTNNPTLKLYRGQTYRFEIDTPNHPMAFATKKSFTPGEAVVIETTDGVRSSGVFDVVLYDQDGTAYDAGGFIIDPVTQAQAVGSVSFGDATNTSLIYDTGISKVDADGNALATVYIEKGIIEFTIPDTAPDALYYISKNDPNVAGYMQIFDIEDNTAINVEADILGKKTYTTSNGFALSNGMKVEFAGEVTPVKYASNEWYVEGVGDKIKLVRQSDLTVSGSFTDDISVPFDAQGFDFYPFSDAIGYPTKKDYIVINRASLDGNLWSRYNRWFHKSVVETSNTLSNNPSTILEDSRAKRPIIEFNQGLKLFNFGTKSKTDVDLVDTFTTDIFSTIEGSAGYNVDGVNLTNGMRVLFTADTDDLVSGKIYKVSFITFRNNIQISLVEETDTPPVTNENVFVKFGTVNGGKFFSYNGTTWTVSQQKTSINQQPLFDMYDAKGNAFSNTTNYNSTTFAGNKIFAYKVGTGTNDAELGFPLSYRNITNTGDITFDFALTGNTFTYQVGTVLYTSKTETGFLRKYSTIDTFEYTNGWLKTAKLSNQPVIRQYIYDNTTDNFYIDVYNNVDYITNLWLTVYLNNKLQFKDVDYTVAQDVNGVSYITFANSLTTDDVIVLKTKSKYPKNENGYYEIAKNLERNPLNDDITEFTLGEVNDHVSTIVEEINNFSGVFPGPSNLRDIGNLSANGKKFLKHSGPINLAMYHLVDPQANIVKSMRYARREYGKFKRQFLETANTLGFEGPVKEHVDNILKEMNKDKTSSMPFYFSDMIPQGGSVKTTHAVLDSDERYFPLSATFSMSVLSRKAVQIYLNGTQLTHGKDYTFNSEGFADVTATKAVGDAIDVYEYDSTNASFAPPTPTKLGLYPAYHPQIYTDNTPVVPVTVIEGHDGSKFVGYDDFRDNLLLELELRIYNNIKISYDTNIFDIHNFLPGKDRDTGFTRQEINSSMTADFLQWNQLVDGDYVSNSGFDRNNAFTFNYSSTRYKNGTQNLPGHWRQTYMYAFDTDRPHTHPWEMLGFTIKPTWWETTYGPAPYTRNNKVLWQDLEQGIVREPKKSIVVRSKYIRPGLQTTIPTDDGGNLLSPNASGILDNFNSEYVTDNWVVGDGGPVESGWRRSSEYPFSLITAYIQNQPNAIFAAGFDRSRQKRNLANQIVYGDSGVSIKLSNIVFPNTIDDTSQIFTSGLINYISNYLSSNTAASYTKYKQNLVAIKNQIGSKIAGYTDKEKFRLILDSRTPTNEGNVFIPKENYNLILNTSSPIQTVSYSGVMIEKQAEGYVIRGYDNFVPNFKYYKRIVRTNDPIINVGGISESFVNFDSDKTYSVGQIIKTGESFLRVTTTHISSTNIDASKFATIPELPLIGGAVASMPRVFEDTLSTLNYGDKLSTLQDVVDFLYGYGKYLTDQGFAFEERIEGSNEVANWPTSAKQFMFWTTQNWAAGTLITISPGAKKLKLQSSYSVVDNIYDTFYGYSILKGDGKKLNSEYIRIAKGVENECTVTVVNSADGIFAARFPLVQKEHVLLLDNKTVFNDVIYDPAPGYRQERIKVLGYRTDNWNGSLNIPGFIYDNANAVEWEAWSDYTIGDLVKYKEFYYSADKKITGTQLFNADDWNRLDKKPEAGLLTNFDYKINQFADFYDLDSDNFDTEQQRLAQHLIGYQKRTYLENIINDDVSQYKFYQGFILDKGSKNSLTKLFDALASADQESLEFFEEWAIKDGQYGASEGFEEVEYLLDETQFRLDPQPILLTDTGTGQETDLVYRIKDHETYLKSNNYDHSPFPTKYIQKGYTKDSGYVNPKDVDLVVSTYNDIANKNFDDINSQDYVWVGNVNQSWSVYQHVITDYIIEAVETSAGEFTITVNATPLDISTGDVLGLFNLLIKTYAPGQFDSALDLTQTVSPIKGFYKVKSVALNKITFETTETIVAVEECEGKLSKFISVRVGNLSEANTLAEQEIDAEEKLWIDNAGNDKWLVLQNKNKFNVQQELSNSETGTDHNYGTSIAVDDRNVRLAVGAPDLGDNGKVFVYNRSSNALNYTLSQVLDPEANITATGQKYGYDVSMSGDGEYIIVGAPYASNVKTNFKNAFSTTANYAAGDIVSLNNGLWQADDAILGAVSNITFNSFNSVAQINYDINNYTQDAVDIPVILTGDYPFKNITTDHFLLRAPKAMYDGSGQGDQIYLRWNSLANANQTQINLTTRAPFDGSIPYLSKEYLESEHTISYKIDAILYIDASNNIPAVGDIVTTQGATATVVYVHNESAQLTIYVNNINGEFPLENSLFINGNDFIGEYQRIGPNESITTTGSWGGYWFIQSSNPYAVGSTNADAGRSLVFKDFVSISDVATDSTLDGYYYNSLDYATSIQNSESVINSFIQTLSFTGTPGPLGSSTPVVSRKFVVRAPKLLSDASSAGEKFTLYLNNLPDTVTTVKFDSLLSIGAGEIITQAVTGATAVVLENTTSSYTAKVNSITGSFDLINLLSFSSSGNLGIKLTELPVQSFISDPSAIGLNFSATNKEHTIDDIWDGYISFVNTKFLNGEPFEPIVGQTVRDKSTQATAEVAYYQRSLNNVTIFVKNVSGNWSLGNQFGNNAEIEMMPYAPGPNPDVYGRSGIYTIPRVMGQIQRVNLGTDSAGIGKLFVVDTNANITAPAGDFRTASQLGAKIVNNSLTGDFAYLEPDTNFEYWMYKQTVINGIPRSANTPTSDNLDWTEVYKVPTASTGSIGDTPFTNEGIYYIYQKNNGGIYISLGSFVGPERQSNNYLGSIVEVTKSATGIYRGFVSAPADTTVSNPGKIYFLKNGTENGILYNWEYAKNKNYKGEFNASSSYFTGNIVSLDDKLYNAVTNITAGTFNALQWNSTDDLIDYVGYVPNDTGVSIINDSSYDLSTVLDQGLLYDFANSFDVTPDGEVLIVNAKYGNGKPNLVVVYRILNGQYQRSQQLTSPSNTEAFGESIAISTDGKLIAVSAPLDDTNKNNQGKVYIYKKVNEIFVFSQTLMSPNNKTSQFFGDKIDFDGNRLVVNSKNGNNWVDTTFDVYSSPTGVGYTLDKTSTKNLSSTVFDNDFTTYKKQYEQQGSIYVYEVINDTMMYAQQLQYQNTSSAVTEFGKDFKLKNNHVYVGLPKVSVNAVYTGSVIDFRIPDNKMIWETLRQPKDAVDISKIKRAILYNVKTNKLLTYLDYIDPVQGKVAGPAEQNLTYKTYYDPAYYTVGDNNVTVMPSASWGAEQVGELWWNLTNAKYLNAYQSDVIFSANNWSQLFDSNTVDVYEWVESDVLPSVWNSQTNQTAAVVDGIDGTSLYADTVYSSRQTYDKISGTLGIKYYFWVKNKRTMPDVDFRTISSFDVAKLIEDPKGQGYKFAALISENSFTLYNCESLLENKDVAFSLQYWTIDNQDINIHNQYQIVTDGLSTSKPNRDIERKWFDSLVGYDEQSKQVPSPNLSPKQKYGILNSPRQSWFVNSAEALKQVMERVNAVLLENLIIDNKDLTKIKASALQPSVVSREFDTTVDTVADLEFIGVAKAQQATMQLTVNDGVITNVVVLNAGRGYLVAPTYKIVGTGTGAELEFTINNLGVITNVSVVNGGTNYSSTDVITIRRYTALVKTDETILGKWALYERDSTARIWQRTASQSYDVTLFWDYIDWYATGYTQFTETNFVIEGAYQLPSINDTIGDVVKINNVGSGGWLLLRKITNQANVDYTINYETIGRQNGTIKFKNTLYDTAASATGFDIISFDSQFFDSVPSTEIRAVLNCIKHDLFTEELALEYNKLFFASLRYVFSEQQNVDWAFKTSFVKAKHNVGQLREDITFNNDSLPSYEKYLEEVKPFKTKLREYLSAYEKLDNSQSRVTDFDLQPIYNDTTKLIEPQNVKVVGDTLIGINDSLETYPFKNWTDNVGFKVTEIQIANGGSGYTQAPTIKLTGGGGTGATAIAKLGVNGTVTSVEVTNKGSSYITAPTLMLTGSVSETGKNAKLSVILGDGLTRGMLNVVKFDRVSGDYSITSINETETFTGTGSKYIYELKWPMDLKTTNVTVTVNNIELLRSEYSFINIKDSTTTSYTRYHGKITLAEPTPVNTSIVITYKKAISLLTAQDRINIAYNPVTGQFAKDLGQLMDGVDYGGVEVKSFDFGGPTGWDTAPWFTSEYDTYDQTFEDETFTLDGSTISVTLATPLESGVVYNLYKNGVRLDDPDWVNDSSQFTNPNAVMRSITGDGVQTLIELDELGISNGANDVIVIRKSTSDGSFLPVPGTYDTLIEGGALEYNTAKGILAEEINIDGDGFATTANSGGPDENLPGRVFDTVDIKVYERPTGGSSKIHSRNYVGDGTTTDYDIGTTPILDELVFVKVNNVIQTAYTIDYETNKVKFTTAPTLASKINLVTLDYSGTNILDLDEFISDGSTADFLTNITHTPNLSSLVTIDGKKVEHVLTKSNNTYAAENRIVIRFAEPPKIDAVVKYAIFEGPIQNFSAVTIDEFIADGSTILFDLTQTPFTQKPHEWFTIVQVNNTILNAGYSQKYVMTESREYQLKLWQVPTGSVRSGQLRIYLNGQKINYIDDWSFTSAGQYNSALDADDQLGSAVLLNASVGAPGDILRIYIVGQEDSTAAGGDYRYGYFDNDNNFVEDDGKLSIYSTLSNGDKVKVYQFSNHDTQGIERQSLDVVERTLLSPGVAANRQVFEIDGSTANLNLLPPLAARKQYAVYLNNTRIDDPNYNTAQQTNDNAVLLTITGAEQTIFDAQATGLVLVTGDILEIVELGASVTPDSGTADWYELRQLRAGYINLQSPAVDDQYVWVVKNGTLLDPSVDYVVTPNKMRIKLKENLDENDTVETFHFAKETLKNKFGWRQFKDILNRDIYKRLDGRQNYRLSEPLAFNDKVITVDNSTNLPDPVPGSKYPGVIFVDNERIEYFRKTGNTLGQLRRGTLGTGIKSIYSVGTELYDQSQTATMPYKDEVLTSTFTADGTSAAYDLDFTPASVNEFEVFVAGRRLRKTALESYQLDTTLRTTYATSTEQISQDSPLGDVTLPAEFSIQNSNELVLLETPGVNQKVIVIRKQGRIWNVPGTALSNAESDISRFLRSATVDLP